MKMTQKSTLKIAISMPQKITQTLFKKSPSKILMKTKIKLQEVTK